MAIKTIEILYNGNFQKWNLDCDCTPPLYRILNDDVKIWFVAEWRNGCYFHIKSVTYNGKTYETQRYHYKFIPLVREAAFWIYENEGLWSYTDNKRHFFVNNNDETVGSFLGKKLNMRVE